MIRLPVWELGLVILVPMATAYLVREFIQKKLVETAPQIRQAFLQFRMDLLLFLGAGLMAALILQFGYSFPILQSGLKLALGIFTIGFFAGLDLGLERERTVINTALTGQAEYDPPRKLTPMTRKFSFVATLTICLITSILLLVIIRDVQWLANQELTMSAVGFLNRSVLLEIIFIMAFLLIMVVNLIFSYTKNLRLLFNTETMVLENIAQGDLTRRVPVTTSDELGVIAGHTNAMIGALREGVRMREGLLIAKEVQQHFLPSEQPDFPGLDIAGVSLFSDETGGDFYDFIQCDLDSCGQLAVAVGDVSGHGIGAALLMTAGRAVIRQNAATPGSATENIARANKHLTHDIGETGRFMTLFFMVMDPTLQTATWVNAGHQQPLVYAPATDTFTELRGADIPLGVESEWKFHEKTMDLPDPGEIIFICTDGIWEAHSPAGEMFGGERIREIIRKNNDKDAQTIMKELCDAVLEFSGSDFREDDLTLVVIKGVES
ncbi:PP2C family protein-serine/threonine phosphatase [Pseudodesulfovibrio nedwellii]|uniref:PP2C family protein-serine/threonine phosphatase n=1 Tax=Pseudodesulfovibrio nedwellii TaxID=2973072 RepID=UPI002493C102|nr:SpoIIE family protein phosphatase [Pseudodesulfovibrio nedwellii]